MKTDHIKSLRLQDFRLHTLLNIEFDPQVTTIVGRSYAGKSTIIRALKWVCLNKPAGSSMIRWGEKRARVSLTLDDFVVVRVRGKRKNQYWLKRKGKKEKFEAFGNETPSKIADILNLSENNFQGQHSLPFWFGETAGEISRKLNGIVNLSMIDSTLSNLNSMQHRAKTEVEVGEGRQKEAKERIEELKYVEEMKDDWGKVRKLEEAYGTIEDEMEELQERLVRCEELQKTIQQTKPPSIKKLTAAYDRLSEIEEEYTELEIMIDRVERAVDAEKRLRKISERLQKELKNVLGTRCPLCHQKIKS
jgi:DNA repair protein SbcC/Rad50